MTLTTKFDVDYEAPTTREIAVARANVTFYANRASDLSRTRDDRAACNAKANAARARLRALTNPEESTDA